MALGVTFERDDDVFCLPIGKKFRYRDRDSGQSLMLTGVRMAEDDEIPLLYGQTMLGEPVEITVHEALDDFDIYEMMDAPLWTLPHKTTTSSSGYYYLNGRTTSH